MSKMNLMKIYKIIPYLFVLFGLVSIGPIIYCGIFDYANGDDLIGSATAHNLIKNGTNVFEYFYRVCIDVKELYLSRGGNWASTFVWYAFQPSILSERLYAIVPIIGYISVGLCTFCALKHFLAKYFALPTNALMIIISTVLIFIFQFAPYIRPMLFWWTGMVVYMVPFGLMELAMIWLDCYVDENKIRYLILLAIAFLYIGGAGYFTAVVSLEIFAVWIAFVCIVKKDISRLQKIAIVFTFGVLLASFLFSFMAPGNKVRAASEGVDISMNYSSMISTILDCVIIGTKDFVIRFVEIRPLIFLVIIVFVIAWAYVDCKKVDYSHPILFITFVYLLYCSSYSPMLFADTSVSGGGPDDIYFFFIIAILIMEIYSIGAIKHWRNKKGKESWIDAAEQWNKKVVIPTMLVVAIMMLAGFRYLVGNSSWYLCKNFIESGQLSDFNKQMQERIAILESDEEEIVLPMMNDSQGPFMHMPLVEDPNAYPNVATARFYNKKQVIAIPRDEWEKRSSD